MYETTISLSFSSFFPKIPSPNNNSYLSSAISWIKYISDVFVMFNILSTLLYSLDVSSPSPLILTTMVDVSTNEF